MVSFKTVLWSLPVFLTLPDSSGWDWEGTRRLFCKSLRQSFSPSVAGSPCRQAVSFYGVLVSLRQAISSTKRFSNSTAFVKSKNQTWLSCKITVKNDLWKVREGDVQDLSLDLLLGRTIKGSSISGGGWYPYRNVFQCLITFCNWERGFPLFNLNLSYNCSYLLQFFCVLWTWRKVFTLFEGSFHVPQLPQYFPPSHYLHWARESLLGLRCIFLFCFFCEKSIFCETTIRIILIDFRINPLMTAVFGFILCCLLLSKIPFHKTRKKKSFLSAAVYWHSTE